jgi:hypothetical protein
MTTAVALTVFWASVRGDCIVGGASGDCGIVTGATTVISGRGDGTSAGVNGTTTGGRSFLAVPEVIEEDSSTVPSVVFDILVKYIKM